YGHAADLTNPASRGVCILAGGLGIPHRAEPPCSGSAIEAKASTTRTPSTAPGDRPGPAAGSPRRGQDPGRADPFRAHQPVVGPDDPAGRRERRKGDRRRKRRRKGDITNYLRRKGDITNYSGESWELVMASLGMLYPL